MTNFQNNLETIRARIEKAAQRAGRKGGDIRLIAVSKTVPVEGIEEALAAGLRDFGENRVQEAMIKIPVLAGDWPDATWHMIGHLQSNKAAKAAEIFQRVDSVHERELIERLEKQCAGCGKFIDLLLEVHLSAEVSKSGMPPHRVAEALEYARALSHVRVRGLMTMAPLTKDEKAARAVFAQLRELQQQLNKTREASQRLDILSMGMSGDFEWAIEEGSTEVRLGQALFGARRQA